MSNVRIEIAISVFTLFLCVQMHPLFHEIESIYTLLMNFAFDSDAAKAVLAKAGLADVIHKLWAHTSLHKRTLITTLKLIATFTSNCLEGIVDFFILR